MILIWNMILKGFSLPRFKSTDNRFTWIHTIVHTNMFWLIIFSIILLPTSKTYKRLLLDLRFHRFCDFLFLTVAIFSYYSCIDCLMILNCQKYYQNIAWFLYVSSWFTLDLIIMKRIKRITKLQKPFPVALLLNLSNCHPQRNFSYSNYSNKAI